jgi:hypothetical protein
MTARYVVAAIMILVGLIFIGQGIGFIPGSGMSGVPFWALVGAILVVAGVALVWVTRRSVAS